MLEETRYKKYFDIIGDRNNHFGPFAGCSNLHNSSSDDDQASANSYCC